MPSQCYGIFYKPTDVLAWRCWHREILAAENELLFLAASTEMVRDRYVSFKLTRVHLALHQQRLMIACLYRSGKQPVASDSLKSRAMNGDNSVRNSLTIHVGAGSS